MTATLHARYLPDTITQTKRVLFYRWLATQWNAGRTTMHTISGQRGMLVCLDFPLSPLSQQAA